MISVCYSILHYNTSKDTIACVDSIRKYFDSPIVIVCNGSKNDSDKRIKEKYENIPNIYVVNNSENKGFACGNNDGIMYARKHELGEIIVCINNDILIQNSNFEEILINNYLKHKYAVAGVDIVNNKGTHCNPWIDEYPTKEVVEKTLRYYKKGMIRCTKLGGLPDVIYRCFQRIKKGNKKQQAGREHPFITLHGSCVAFSPEFFICFSGFCPKTFLFGEELILAYQCDKAGLLMQYIGQTSVLHNESSSTKTTIKGAIKRHLFFYENIYQSTKVLLELLEME